MSAAQDVGRTISDYAAKANADAVVIGSRGLGAFRRRMLVSPHCVATPFLVNLLSSCHRN